MHWLIEISVKVICMSCLYNPSCQSSVQYVQMFGLLPENIISCFLKTSQKVWQKAEFVPSFKQTRETLKHLNGLSIWTCLYVHIFRLWENGFWGFLQKDCLVIKRIGKSSSCSTLWRYRTPQLEQNRSTSPSIPVVFFLNAAVGRTKDVWCFRGELQSGQTTPQCAIANIIFAASFLFKIAISLTLTEKVIILQFHWAIKKKKKVHWNSRRWNTVLSGLVGSLSTFRAEKHKFIF